MTLRGVALLLIAAVLPTSAAPPGPLVVLAPTSETRNGLPVLARRPPGGEVERVLRRGFSGRLLRLYALEQEYLRRETGAAPEPAYLLLSDKQGGFPRFGLVIDGVEKPGAGYVDLHQRSPRAGRFGAMDQIFPHELLHVVARQLAGEPRESGANQVHAIGVRTDPVTAFQEGFAEHVQIMCVDDADADPSTQALKDDQQALARAEREFERYGRSVGSRFGLGSPSEMRFLIWFSSAEQVLRYHAVKANRFAKQPPVPDRLLRRTDKYAAYRYQNVALSSDSDPAKAPGVLLATEGVVAHLFWRWVTDHDLQHRYRDAEFYSRFGVGPADVDPADNVYLKIFHALRAGRAGDTLSFLRAYIREFPDESDRVQQVVRDSLAGQAVPEAPELWLANPALQTGTSLFDQFRALPRTHTFDANAASTLDWLAVPGATPATAGRMLASAPFRDLAAVERAFGVEAPLQGRVEAMSRAMAELRASEQEDELSLAALIRAYVWRLALYVLSAAAFGAWIVRRTFRARWRWAIPCGLLSATLVFTFAWVIVSPAWLPLGVAVALGGLPSAAWVLGRRRSWALAARAVGAWAAAALPAAILSAGWW